MPLASLCWDGERFVSSEGSGAISVFQNYTISFATDKPFSSQQSEVANGSFCHCLRFYGSEYCVRVSGQKVLGIPRMIDLGYGCRYVDYSVKEEKTFFFLCLYYRHYCCYY